MRRRVSNRLATIVVLLIGVSLTVGGRGAAADPVTGALAGMVTDSHGNPLPGVAISLQGPGGTVADGTSGTDGTYTFTDLVPGQYGLCFIPQQVDTGSSTTGYLNTCPDRPLFGTVSAGQSLQLPPEVLRPAAAVAGIVTDSNGTPLSGITVSAGAFLFLPSSTTDATGYYRIVGLEPSTFSVCTRPSDTVQGSSQAGYLQGCTATVQVSLRQTTAAPDLVDPSAVGLSGTVTDSSRHPVENVGIDLSTSSFSSERITNTDANGHYTILGLSPSQAYYICFDTQQAVGGSSPTGYRSRCYLNQPGDHRVNGSTLTSTPIPATVPGVIVGGIDQKLPNGGEVAGRVSTQDGTPMVGVQVVVNGLSDGASYGGAATTDSHGYYRVRNLNPGTYWVCFLNNEGFSDHATPEGYLDQCYRGQTDPDHAWTPITVSGAAITTIPAHLVRGAIVTGTVTGTSGQPVAGVEVVVHSSSDTAFATTAADGTYSAIGLTTGTYAICYYAAGYQTQCYKNASFSNPRQVNIRQNTVRTGFDAVLQPTP